MSRPICVPCRVMMTCELNGQIVNDPRVGGFEATYNRGDKWRCGSCDHEIVTGLGASWTASERPELPTEGSIEYGHYVGQLDEIARRK